MRILVTNDDGIDSVGLHVLARAMTAHGDVIVVAPDREYSGAGAALGALHLLQPEVQRRTIDGVPEAWAVNGAPALCVFFARLGVFGEKFDLVVSGINPGANVGRSVYHSGTVGAALTARLGGINAIAVSQAVTGFGVEGQGWDEIVTRATLAHRGRRGVDDGRGARRCSPGSTRGAQRQRAEPRARRDQWMAACRRRHRASASDVVGGHGAQAGTRRRLQRSHDLGDPVELPIDTDGGAVEAGEVAVTYLSRLEGLTGLADEDAAGVTAAERKASSTGCCSTGVERRDRG